MTNVRELGLGVCAVIALCGVTACDRGTAEAKQDKPAATAASAPVTVAKKAEAPAAKTVELKIASIGNQMKFDQEELSVPAGTNVHLKLTNNSTLKVMPHNWLLVKAGTEAAVAVAGLEKGEPAGYVAPGPDVLAYTPLAGPGATVEVTFPAPAPGKYPYICTVPGHYVVMKGVLTVTP